MVKTGEGKTTVRIDDEGEHIDVCIGAPAAHLGAKAHAPVSDDGGK
jgi:hypothetical protein